MAKGNFVIADIPFLRHRLLCGEPNLLVTCTASASAKRLKKGSPQNSNYF